MLKKLCDFFLFPILHLLKKQKDILEEDESYFILKEGRKIPIKPVAKTALQILEPFIASLRWTATIGIIVGIGVVLSVPYHAFQNAQIHREYIQTVCTVLDKKIDSLESSAYRATLLLQYHVKNSQYVTWLSPVEAFGKKSYHEGILRHYQKGENYPCWYDPQKPHRVIIVLPKLKNVFFTLFLGVIVILFSVIVRFFLSPLFWRAIKFQKDN